MKRVLFIGLLFSLPFLQSCSCFVFAGGEPAIKGGYFRFKIWKDTTQYYQIMQQIGIRYPELLLRRNNPVLDSLKKYFTYVGAIKRLNDTSILTPTYPIQDYFGFYSWDMKSTKKDLIFRIGLNIEGFCLAEVYEVNKRLINKYSTYNLCSLPSSERRRLRKYYIKRFEEEIIPLMKPYFEEYKKRKQ